jgi:hypothetical protein
MTGDEGTWTRLKTFYKICWIKPFKNETQEREKESCELNLSKLAIDH